MNDFDKGFMMGMAMGSDDDPPPRGGCFTDIFMTIVFGALFFIGAILVVLILIWLIGGR